MEQAMIEIQGLTPKKDARDARTLIEMMQLAFLDEVDDIQVAQRVIQRLVDKR
jgi:hypothetical protein